ncbi:MAG: hypothetical protein FJ313_04375, partial [Gemmatimonadetes bacterium]|nr:hypothetical protein [Gemmatimonadota bacterium]
MHEACLRGSGRAGGLGTVQMGREMMVKPAGWLGHATLGLLLAAFGFPSAVRAADPIGSLSLSGRLGVGGLAMGDVNDAIARSNYLLGQQAASMEWKVPE